jgi:hypothetical protein
MTPAQVQQLGTSVQPGNEQDTKFRTIFASAAAVITGATRDMVRFESLDYVANVQAADLVISLTGGSGRMGWATPGSFGARPGHIGVYYQSLTKEREEDAILIVAHLLSHYLFDLPDEISDDELRASCPQQNPDGPGCLMDNFFADGPRRGYYGKFCGDKDHNPAAPVSSTLSAKHKPQESCQFRVNHFLRRNSVTGDISSSSTPTDRFQSLEFATRAHTRFGMIRNNIGTSRRSLACSDFERDQLRSIARKYLDEQLAFIRRDPDFHDRLGMNEVPDAVERVVNHILFEPIERPSGFDQSLADTLQSIARAGARKAVNELALTAGSQPVFVNPGVHLDSMTQQVKWRLLEYLTTSRDFVRTNDPGLNSILPQDERFIEMMARDAVAQLLPKSGSNPAPKTLTIPGQQAPVKQVAGETRQSTQALILTPLPLEAVDIVRSDTYEVVSFATLCEMTLGVIGNPLGEDAVGIQVIRSSLCPASEERWLRDSALRLLLKLGPGWIVTPQERRDDLDSMVDECIKRLNGQTTRNVIIVLSPGSTSADLMGSWNKLLRWARSKQGNPTKFDVLKIGLGHVSFPIQQLATSTGGSVRRVEYVHELGACAQQLKSCSFSGSAINVPEHGVVDLEAVKKLLDPNNPEQRDPSRTMSRRGQPPDAEPSRSTVPITKLSSDPHSIEIELESFQAEEGTGYEFILGLSRPLKEFPTSEEGPEKAPRLVLYRDGQPTDHPYLALDRRISSPRMLVFRVPVPDDSEESNLEGPSFGLPQGVYTPKLQVRGDSLPIIHESSPVDPRDSLVGFTFSIASDRDSIQLFVEIREPVEFASTHAVASSDREIILETEAFAGAPVLDCQIRGVVRRSDSNTPAGSTFGLSFRDDGIFPDLHKDDGIATARISLPQPDRRTSAEYKISVEARSTPQSRFISLVDPVLSHGLSATARKPAVPGVPVFQRAKVLDLHIRGRQ